MGMIVPMIVDAIVERLTDTLITSIPPDDPTRADIVKAGRFQDNPIHRNVYAAVTGGDPDDPNYKDGIITLEDMDRIGWRFPVREIGGGELWWRRGIVSLGCYFIRDKASETLAAQYAYDILGRIEKSLSHMPLTNLSDDYGEKGIFLTVYGNTFSESGGPPTSYIWRGKVFWSALTRRL